MFGVFYFRPLTVHSIDGTLWSFCVLASAAAVSVNQVDIITPEEYMGDVIGDINGRRGQIIELVDRNGLKQVESTVPLANMFQVRAAIIRS